MIYFESGFTGNTYGLEHPRILWNSVTRRGTVSASTEAAGFEGVNAATATTYDAWKPTGPDAAWDLTFDATETVSAVAIDSHTLGSTQSDVIIREWDGALWVPIMPEVSPANDDPIAFLFSARSLSQIRVGVNDGAAAPQIGVIHVCEALELPQTVYMGAPTPIDMGKVTGFQTNQSATGQYLGRSIRTEKPQNDFTVSNLSESWVRTNLLPFIDDAREYPYFLLERPQTRPTALSYRWRDRDIRPERIGATDLMQVAL